MQKYLVRQNLQSELELDFINPIQDVGGGGARGGGKKAPPTSFSL